MSEPLDGETLGDIFRNGQVAQIRPGDTLLFKFDQRHLDADDAAYIRDYIRSYLPASINFLVVGAGVEVSVVRQEDLNGPGDPTGDEVQP